MSIYRSKYLLNIFLFASTLVIFNVTFERYSTVIPPQGIWKRIQYFHQNHEQFDHVMVGSSVVLRGFVPHFYNRRMQRHGLEIDSYNIGIPGIGIEEGIEISKYLLQGPHAGLKMILMDVSAESRLFTANWYSHQLIWWHTPRATWNAIVAVFASDFDWRDRTIQVVGHTAHMFVRTLHVGYIPKYIESLSWETSDIKFRGYHSMDDYYKANATDPLMIMRKASLTEYEDFFLRGVDLVRDSYTDSQENQPQTAAPRLEHRVRYLDEIFKDTNIKVVYITLPNIRKLQAQTHREFSYLRSQNPDITFVDMSNPNEFPDLFAAGNFFDFMHLNNQGAIEFSVQLADEMADML